MGGTHRCQPLLPFLLTWPEWGQLLFRVFEALTPAGVSHWGWARTPALVQDAGPCLADFIFLDEGWSDGAERKEWCPVSEQRLLSPGVNLFLVA